MAKLGCLLGLFLYIGRDKDTRGTSGLRQLCVCGWAPRCLDGQVPPSIVQVVEDLCFLLLLDQGAPRIESGLQCRSHTLFWSLGNNYEKPNKSLYISQELV